MNTKKINIRKLEADLWESADLLRAGSKLTSCQYCMPVLALLFLRYAYSRYKMVEQEIMANRPMRNGRAMPIEASNFQAKSALFFLSKFAKAVASDDGVEFALRMKEIHEELAQLHAEANRLMDDIQKTWEGLV